MEWTENVKGLQHIGIPTGNIEKTVEFYKKIGFRPVLETENQGLRVVFLKTGDLVLETYECEMPAMRGGAIDHMALNVADIEAAFNEAEKLDAKVIEPITFLPFWERGVKYFVTEGPNREKIEFAQYM